MTSEHQQLLNAAARARQSAYAPYSNFKVGAALNKNIGDRLVVLSFVERGGSAE